MLSDDWSSTASTTTPKVFCLKGYNWITLYAGDPGTRDAVITHAIRDLAIQPEPVSTAVVMNIVTGAYQTEIRARIEATILAPYGLTIEAFRQCGLATFGQSGFDRICQAMEQVDLDLELIVSGFGKESHRWRSLFAVSRRGDCKDWTAIGFHAIGAGSWTALSALYTREALLHASTAELMYRLLEARFLSENARSVGRETIAFAFTSSPQNVSVTGSLDSDLIETIRAAWTAEYNRPIPSATLELLAPQFKF